MELADINLTIPLIWQILLVFPMAAAVAAGIWFLWPPVSWVFFTPIMRLFPQDFDRRDLRPAVVKGGVFGTVAGWLILVLLLWYHQQAG